VGGEGGECEVQSPDMSGPAPTSAASLAVLKWRDHAAHAQRPPIHVPMAVPILGAIACVGLLIAAV